jgi:hypothetical protein
MDLICSEKASKHSLRVKRAFNMRVLLAVNYGARCWSMTLLDNGGALTVSRLYLC